MVGRPLSKSSPRSSLSFWNPIGQIPSTGSAHKKKECNELIFSLSTVIPIAPSFTHPINSPSKQAGPSHSLLACIPHLLFNSSLLVSFISYSVCVTHPPAVPLVHSIRPLVPCPAPSYHIPLTIMSSIAPLYSKLNAARIAKEIIKGIPAGLVISLNAWGTCCVATLEQSYREKEGWRSENSPD